MSKKLMKGVEWLFDIEDNGREANLLSELVMTLSKIMSRCPGPVLVYKSSSSSSSRCKSARRLQTLHDRGYLLPTSRRTQSL